MVQQIVFIIISTLTLIMAWVVVTNRNLFHAALALMATFLGVAALYATLEAGFLAAAQLLVYIGAISILVIFAIMMTRRLMQTTETSFNSQWVMGAITSLVLFGVMAFVILQFWGFEPGEPPFGMAPTAPEGLIASSVEILGISLVNPEAYVLPFELTSLLLLAALVGAVVVAWPERKE
ncbi:MAG: NADH-quinone oxidoreductase subunit J [Candidatus Promineifilaceae bacterium]|nr:NADH-quinone oxidoreductase subunit J [Candidatus Promineifilaceae bacterium]